MSDPERVVRTAHRRRLAVPALLLGAAIAIAGSARMHGTAERAVVAVSHLIDRQPVWGALAFVGLAALSAMLAFFSSAIVVPVAVHQWGAPLAVLLLWVGWIAGGPAAYAIGRYLGRAAVQRLVSAARVQYWEERVTAHASLPVILLFQAAVPSEIPGYVLGIVRYPFPRYLLALSVTELPFAVGTVLLGTGFLNRQYWLMGAVGLAGLGLVAWAIAALHRQLAGGATPIASRSTRPSA